MNEVSLRISEAALEALRLGEDDPLRVLEVFRQRAPRKLQLPDDLNAKEGERIRKLIERTVSVAQVVHGTKTFGFPSVLGLGSTLEPKAIGATGFLISPDILMTAAHVINQGGANGVWLENLLGERTRLNRLNGAFKPHDQAPRYDFGLIRLEQQVANVEIFPIASSAAIDDAQFFRIVGFGRDERDHSGMKKTAPVWQRPGRFPDVDLLPNEIVIGDPLLSDDGDGCFGDSGGPVLVYAGGNYRIAGVIRKAVGRCGDGTLCPRLDRFTRWIDDNIAALGGQPRPL